MLIFQNFFSQVENLNSQELDRVSMGISALLTLIPRKITVGICMELRTGMAAATLPLPSTHSIGDSPSQVPGRVVHVSVSLSTLGLTS